MTEFLNAETHTQVLLIDNLQSFREVWYRVSTVFFTHFPDDRNGEICQRTKITRAPCRRRIGGAVPRAEKIGDLITADHKVLSEGCESRNNHRYAVVVQDLATQWIESYPCKTKTSQETQRSLQKFLEPNRKPKVICTDNSFEFGKACEVLSWNHCTLTPHRSETNATAERAVRRVKEGTSAALLQSGLGNERWVDSMECYAYLRNIQDLLSDGKIHAKGALENHFLGPIMPFGSLVEYYPISAKDQSRIHQFVKKVLLGLFFGYALFAGEIWKGDILVADIEELATMDASEIYSKKTQCKGSNISQTRRIYFSNRRWTNQNPWRRSGTENIDLDTAATNSRRKSPWFSWTTRRVSSTTSWLISGCRWSDKWFWSMSGNFIYRLDVEHRVKLYSLRGESFPIQLKSTDASRTTRTNLDVMQERRIDDYWISMGQEICLILGLVSLSSLC